MIACDINKRSFKYQTLKKMSGISEFNLDNTITLFQNKFGRDPELDELPNVNSEPYLREKLPIKDYSSMQGVKNDAVLEYTSSDTIEQANVVLNNQYKDLEIELIPYQTFSAINIKHRPSTTQDITDPIDVETDFSIEKSKIVLTNQLNKLQKLYGIDIIATDSEKLKELGIPNTDLVKGVIHNGTIYINTDNSTIDTPIHELMHIFFGSIRYTNPNLFFSLVNSVEQLPRYEEFALEFQGRTRGDINEEIFVDQFSKFLTGAPSLFDKIPGVDKILYEVLRNVDSLVSGNYSVKSIQNGIFDKSILELSKILESPIVNNCQYGSLTPDTLHRVLANYKEDLISKGKLKEECYG